MSEKKTVGQQVLDLSSKLFDAGDANAMELGEKVVNEERYDKQYESNIVLGKILYPKSDFYVEVHHVTPKVFKGYVHQWIMMPRKSLPLPTFAQTVYRYHHVTGDTETVWTMPDLEGCVEIYNNRDNLDKSMNFLKECVLSFKDGTLFNRNMLKYKETV